MWRKIFDRERQRHLRLWHLVTLVRADPAAERREYQKNILMWNHPKHWNSSWFYMCFYQLSHRCSLNMGPEHDIVPFQQLHQNPFVKPKKLCCTGFQFSSSKQHQFCVSGNFHVFSPTRVEFRDSPGRTLGHLRQCSKPSTRRFSTAKESKVYKTESANGWPLNFWGLMGIAYLIGKYIVETFISWPCGWGRWFFSFIFNCNCLGGLAGFFFFTHP